MSALPTKDDRFVVYYQLQPDVMTTKTTWGDLPVKSAYFQSYDDATVWLQNQYTKPDLVSVRINRIVDGAIQPTPFSRQTRPKGSRTAVLGHAKPFEWFLPNHPSEHVGFLVAKGVNSFDGQATSEYRFISGDVKALLESFEKTAAYETLFADPEFLYAGVLRRDNAQEWSLIDLYHFRLDVTVKYDGRIYTVLDLHKVYNDDLSNATNLFGLLAEKAKDFHVNTQGLQALFSRYSLTPITQEETKGISNNELLELGAFKLRSLGYTVQRVNQGDPKTAPFAVYVQNPGEDPIPSFTTRNHNFPWYVEYAATKKEIEKIIEVNLLNTYNIRVWKQGHDITKDHIDVKRSKSFRPLEPNTRVFADKEVGAYFAEGEDDDHVIWSDGAGTTIKMGYLPKLVDRDWLFVESKSPYLDYFLRLKEVTALEVYHYVHEGHRGWLVPTEPSSVHLRLVPILARLHRLDAAAKSSDTNEVNRVRDEILGLILFTGDFTVAEAEQLGKQARHGLNDSKQWLGVIYDSLYRDLRPDLRMIREDPRYPDLLQRFIAS